MLQFITHQTDTISYLDSVRLALKGGCRWIQLRMKHASEEEILPIAEEALQLCHNAGAKLIIDDHVLLCQQIHADGVHLGKTDMPIDQARAILGNQYIIGGTANTIEDIRLHVQRGADYIGCGPYRFTTTKDNLAPILGLEGYRKIIEAMREEKLTIPIIAIGGITKVDIHSLLQTGVSGIALSSTILRAPDPVKETQRIIKLLE